MAVQFDPIAKDESLNTTELTPRNVADVLAQELSNIATSISGGSDKVPKTDVATVEPTNVASRAYNIGELVYVNGNLYKVITAISGGATFTVGTNIQSTKVSEELDGGWSVVNISSLAIKAFVSKREVMITLKGTTVSTSAIGNIISDVTAYGIPSAPDFFATKNNDNNVVGISGSSLTLYASDLASYATGRCFTSLSYPIV